MGTFTQITYHIVFATKDRARCLDAARRNDLLAYIWGITRNTGCHLLRVNAMEDHVHLLVALHPSLGLSEFVKKIKIAASGHIRRENLFPGFAGWQVGYGAFTHNVHERPRLIEYVRNQQQHHAESGEDSRAELLRLLRESGIEPEERFVK